MRHPITRDRYEVVLFDMDGVITDTVSIHATCWKTMFDAFLQKWATGNAAPFRSSDVVTDSIKSRWMESRDTRESPISANRPS